MSALVSALRKEPGVTITPVAPVDNRSGFGGNTTHGPLAATPMTLDSGFPATGVNGYPADAFSYALDNILTGSKKPALVISEINFGVKQRIAWFRANRAKLKGGSVANLNIPSCSKGKLRGTVTVKKTFDNLLRLRSVRHIGLLGQEKAVRERRHRLLRRFRPASEHRPGQRKQSVE